MGICALFAGLLDYPGEDLPLRLDRCLEAVGGPVPIAGEEAAAALRRFREAVGRQGPARLEELYTAAFDMDAGCTLYVGHHLFGETRHRSVFMSRLAAMYADAGFGTIDSDLPDYLPTMLRFVDGLREADESRPTLVDEAMAPAARAAAEALERRDHPYASAMRALVAVLEANFPAAAVTPGGATR
jgi:nitrate reductase molybdenum cofactor assembly chaperone NarJ/NarW